MQPPPDPHNEASPNPEPAAPGEPTLYIGCPMWANRAWVGPYFPESTKPGRELEAYATWCTTVEGNTTFYAEPSADAVTKWAEQAPSCFRFCFKVPQHVTHERRLRNVEEPIESFLEVLAPIHDRLGPIQLQLPASFGPDDLDVLADCLAHLSTAHHWAVEVRHPDFFAGGENERPLNDLLAHHGVDRVTLDSRALFTATPITAEEKEAWERKPRVPVRPVATATQPIVRLIGQRDADADLEHWAPWVPKLAEWVTRGVTPHVFTHTPDNAEAPMIARRLWAAVNALVPELRPLPEPLSDDEQLGLW